MQILLRKMELYVLIMMIKKSVCLNLNLILKDLKSHLKDMAVVADIIFIINVEHTSLVKDVVCTDMIIIKGGGNS